MDTFVFETDLGLIAFSRRKNCLLALSFGHATQRAAIKALTRNLKPSSSAAGWIEYECIQTEDDPLAEQLVAFAKGEPVEFEDLPVDSNHLTDFGQKVIAACRAIPYGETRTYGQLASQAGSPGAARAVGSVMARNRVPLVVPCHRVVPASGKLGGFSAPQGVSMKKRLLEMENGSMAQTANAKAVAGINRV